MEQMRSEEKVEALVMEYLAVGFGRGFENAKEPEGLSEIEKRLFWETVNICRRFADTLKQGEE